MANKYVFKPAIIHEIIREIDGYFNVSKLYGLDAETGEILFDEEVEWSMFQRCEVDYWLRTMYVWLRSKGYEAEVIA